MEDSGVFEVPKVNKRAKRGKHKHSAPPLPSRKRRRRAADDDDDDEDDDENIDDLLLTDKESDDDNGEYDDDGAKEVGWVTDDSVATIGQAWFLPRGQRGAFAQRNIPANDVIAEYVGERLTPAEYLARYPREDAEYVFQVGEGAKSHYIDAVDSRRANFSRYANDPRGSNWPANTLFEIEPRSKRVLLRTEREVCAGDEILIDYGKEYWKNIDLPEASIMLPQRADGGPVPGDASWVMYSGAPDAKMRKARGGSSKRGVIGGSSSNSGSKRGVIGGSSSNGGSKRGVIGGIS